MSDEAERRAWVTLAAADGVGEATFYRLIGHLRSAAAVLDVARGGRGALWREVKAAFEDPRLFSLAARENVVAAARDPDAVHERLGSLGVWWRVRDDADYPTSFHGLDPRPPVIYGVGAFERFEDERVVAVVGTRHPTAAGRALAGSVARGLTRAGVTVISGLAIGIDGVAHAAAVESGGPTVAVIGAGHSDPGPRAHRALLDRILATGGSVISELAPDAVAHRGTFPRRNRLISILSRAVVVIEAPQKSGALITAGHALEQGRELFVAPGRPGDRTVAGCLALLRETPARPLVGVEELLADLDFVRTAGPQATRSGRALDRATALGLLDGPEWSVAVALGDGPATAERLVAATGLPPSILSGALTLLQLRGWVDSIGATFMGAGPLL